MNRKSRPLCTLLITGTFLFQSTACGTILHPERKGQRGGNLDPAIVILDAIGLLFFIIPGAIAFAVDFNNGTIYLPGGKRNQVRQVAFDARRGRTDIEAVLARETGMCIGLDGAQVTEVGSLDEAVERLSGG